LFFLQNLPCLVSFWCMPRGSKMSWPFMNQYGMFFVQTSTLPPRMHQKLTKHGRFCKQNNQLPIKSHVEIKDNSNVLLFFQVPANFFFIVMTTG
jgi:hypothetical protein